MLRAQRRLFLHLSALSDEEYHIYIAALRDVLDDPEELACLSEDELENRCMGVREVRAWMKGRYRDVQDIDKILRLFAPDLAQTDTISGGQFLAALRLVMHVRNGGEVSEGNIFVQAVPMSPTTQQIALSADEEKLSGYAQLSTPGSQPRELRSNPFQLQGAPSPGHLPMRRSSLSHLSAPTLPPPSRTPVSDTSNIPGVEVPLPSPPKSTNPFLHRSKSSAGTTTMPSNNVATSSRSGRIPPLPPRKPHAFSSTSLASTQATTIASSLNVAPSKAGSSGTHHPLHVSNYTSRESHSSHPSLSNFISPLMKQSLEASKIGQNMKKVQDQLEKERVLEVIRSSSTSTYRGRVQNQSGSKSAPGVNGSVSPSARRPVPSPPRSAGAGSVGSFDQVASATLQSAHSQAARGASPDRRTSSSKASRSSHVSTDLPPPQHPLSGPSPLSHTHAIPPTHPDRRQGHRHTSSVHRSLPSPVDSSSTTSPGPAVDNDSPPSPSTGVTRSSRSQSMHQPLSGRASPPLPPPRRRRPESVQVFPGNTQSLDSDTSPSHSNNPFAGSIPSSPAKPDDNEDALDALTRQLSLSSPAHPQTSPASAGQHSETGSLSFSALQRTFSQLHSKAQPKLDRVRYKAEAGLSKRGFVPGGPHSSREDGASDMLVAPDMDGADNDAGGMDSDEGGSVGRGRQEAREREREREEARMLDGEGWTRL